MQTEPIGFKGIEGRFEVDYAVSPITFGKAIVSGDTFIAHLPKSIHGLENAKLMAASKKMAIALQRLVTVMERDPILLGQNEGAVRHAKEALKEAGL